MFNLFKKVLLSATHMNGLIRILLKIIKHRGYRYNLCSKVRPKIKIDLSS